MSEDSLEQIKYFVQNDINSFANEVASAFGVENYAEAAIDFCKLCKPCIVAYLYAAYLSLLEKKYMALMMNMKTFKKTDSSEIFDELEKDKNLLANKTLYADIFWKKLLEFRERAEQTLKNTNFFKSPTPK
jgi:hypothetical protein